MLVDGNTKTDVGSAPSDDGGRNPSTFRPNLELRLDFLRRNTFGLGWVPEVADQHIDPRRPHNRNKQEYPAILC